MLTQPVILCHIWFESCTGNKDCSGIMNSNYYFVNFDAWQPVFAVILMNFAWTVPSYKPLLLHLMTRSHRDQVSLENEHRRRTTSEMSFGSVGSCSTIPPVSATLQYINSSRFKSLPLLSEPIASMAAIPCPSLSPTLFPVLSTLSYQIKMAKLKITPAVTNA